MARKYVIHRDSSTQTSTVDYEGRLNPQQLDVVKAGPGPHLVIAGAGSGKTHTLTYRVAWLLEHGVDPTRILLMTFTNKAAKEMLRRVGDLIKTDFRRIMGGTFHHVGNRILRQHAELIGFQKDFTILDRDDATKLLDNIASDLGFRKGYRHFPKGGVLLSIISYAENTEQPVNSVIARQHPRFVDFTQEIMKVAYAYRERKQKLNVMDFDDLLVRWKDLMVEDKEVRRQLSERFQHVLVDEYQDTNKIQASLVDYMAEEHGNIMVVGDDAQSIYSFRGADYENILQFPKRYPKATLLKLETNYRSTPEILDLANSSIRNNTRQFEKVLRAVRNEGPKPQVVATHDEDQQAEFLGQMLLELSEDGIPFKEMAILYRSHFHSLKTELELNRRGIPYQIRSGLRFFERAHIKDITSFLRVLANPMDEIAWKRLTLLYPGIGKKTADRIWSDVSSAEKPLDRARSDELIASLSRNAGKSWRRCADLIGRLKAENKPASMIEFIMEDGYEEYAESNFDNWEERVEDIRQLGNFALQFNTLEEFLSDLALLTNVTGEEVAQTPDEDPLDSVILSTVHQAKGLEWKQVFVIWMADGKFPHQRSLGEPAQEAEERRLFYVAATRARDGLFLVYPTVANERGTWDVIQKPSRFIQEIDDKVYEEVVTIEEPMSSSPWDQEDRFDRGRAQKYGTEDDSGFYPDPIPDYD